MSPSLTFSASCAIRLAVPSRYGPGDEPGRKRPAHGVFTPSNEPTIVYLTVCTKDRKPWLASTDVQNALEDVWRGANAWLVGYYLLMPDHLHLFCAPCDANFTLKSWVTHWKRKFSCLHLPETGEWQRDFWDTRLRRQESYSEKWRYVQENPIRRGLAARSEDWPYQGMRPSVVRRRQGRQRPSNRRHQSGTPAWRPSRTFHAVAGTIFR